MWEYLTKLYQSDNENKKMMLTKKLRSKKMTKTDTIASCITNLTQIRDQLGVIGEKVDGVELVRTILNGFPKRWNTFV